MPSAKTLDPGKTAVASFIGDNGRAEYRTVTSRVEEAEIGGVAFAVEVHDKGDLVVFVNEHPENIEDGAGHFEVYTPAAHGDQYQAVFNLDQEG